MIRHQTWKRLSVFALCGLLLSWIVSCSTGNVSNNQATSGRQEVEFWTMQLQPQFTNYFNKLIASFEAENAGVKVRWVDVPWNDMQSKILTAVSAKTAPDVVNLNPDFAAQLAARNAWLELDGKIPQPVRQSYLPNIWQASTFNGKSFGIPWYLATQITIYNKVLFQRAGISKPPVTYAELAQVAKQVKEKTGKYAFFITFVPEDSAEVLESLVQMGVKLVDAQGKAAFNSPEGKAAFQYWVDLYKQGLLPKEVLTEGHRKGIELYQAGETAILVTGAQFLNTIAKNAPQIANVSATAPQITGKTGKKSVAVMNLVIPRNTDRADAALKFALFVTNDQNQLAFAKEANVLPSTVKALANPYFQYVAAGSSSVDRARVVSAGQMKQAEVLIPAIKNVNVLQRLIYDGLQASMLGEKSVDQALSDAATEWNQN
ncbi:ABC transporter substrate-binding protein [[Phormidium ambiguum] IAM M-71]|uniref:ABC transporter substrate-binding protein n=1 Tax=[Phormidium ambiguum] IAM M-71 TaxID=454136 RepID=A0A1U7IKK3_9CYAN|nr:ABC transporter substrate-binding protein [Phormidium ambiguum IAM M-71]